jgi:hypothetical protein
MSEWMDTPKRLGSPDNDRTNLQGGPDLDTVRSRDADEVGQDNPRLSEDRSGAPSPIPDPTPSADDPFVNGAPDDSDGNDDDDADVPGDLDPTGADGPSYERDQGPQDDSTGGSTDPNNTLSHSDSGRPLE